MTGEPLVNRSCDWSKTDPCFEIVAVLEQLSGQRPVETGTHLGDPLVEYVDPDALADLITVESSVTISFRFEGYRIQVDSSGVAVFDAPIAGD